MKLRWLAHDLLMLPPAGKLQFPFHTGLDCFFLVFFNRAGWQKTVKHDCWLGFLFSESLAV